jgi:hypothetical protein
LEVVVGYNLLTLELGGFTAGGSFDVGFGWQIRVTYGVPLNLIANGRNTAPECPGNGPVRVAGVEQCSYLVAVSFS